MSNNINDTSQINSNVAGCARTRDWVVLIPLGVMITGINGLIVLAFLMRQNLRRRPANIMICSQACTDLFSAFVYIPVYLVQNEATSILRLFLNCYMLYLSLFNLSMISMDRYLAMNKPFIHRRIINVKRTIKMIIGVWVCPLGLTMVPLFWWFEAEAVRDKATRIYVFVIWFLLLLMVTPMSVMYILATRGAKCNIKSRRASLRGRLKEHATLLAHKEVRAVHLFGLLLFFFVAAYLPILYINFCWFIGAPEYAPPIVEVISLYLLIMNSIINPIICIMLKKDYLLTIKRILSCKYRYAGASGGNRSLFGSDFSTTRISTLSSTSTFDRRARSRKNAVAGPGNYRQGMRGHYPSTIEKNISLQVLADQQTS